MAEVESPLEGEMRLQKKEMLYDIYKKEAEMFMTDRKFSKALQSYNLAIKIQPTEKGALLGRSKCYLHLGKTYRAMQDAEKSLTIDASDLEAVYQKAEILFLTGNYQLALVYYKRGLRLNPDDTRFEDGRQRTAAALHRFGGGNVAKNKLSAVGDLSFFLNNKMRKPLSKDMEEYDPNNQPSCREDLPSAGFRNREHNPLRRITRKPRFPQLQSFDSLLSLDGADDSPRQSLRQPDEETMRKILGELYGDRQYLQRLQTDLPDEGERELTMLTDEGLEFLRERSVFWDSLGPLPPPVPPRRPLNRERTFGSLASGESSVNHDLPWRRRNMDQAPAPKDISEIIFDFRSHLKTRQRERRGEPRAQQKSLGIMGNVSGLLPLNRNKAKLKKVERTMFVGFDDPDVERRRELAKFINDELDTIDEAFKAKEYSECLHKAEVCLHAVSSLSEEDIKKAETVASLHSCIGNACIALRQFDKAYKHHQTALQIGEKEKSNSIVARSLGHMGRMYIIQQKFNKALEVFARKAPMCISLEEVAQTFHEIGNCFLVLGHFDYARDCGKKALRAARSADLPFFQQQAWILIAIAEAKLQHFEECHKAFGGALKVAKEKNDIDSAAAIQGAMDHISRKMDQILRTKTLVNQRMLMRKTKELTRADLPQNANRRRKPLPPVKHYDAVSVYTVEAQEAEGEGPFDEEGNAMEQSEVARQKMEAARERAYEVMERGTVAADNETVVMAQQAVGMEPGLVADQETFADQEGATEDQATEDTEQTVQKDIDASEAMAPGTEQEPPVDNKQDNAEDTSQDQHDRVTTEDTTQNQQQQFSDSQTQHIFVNPGHRSVDIYECHDRNTAPQNYYNTTGNLTSQEVNLLSIERSQRHRERERFRREATVGSVNIDSTTYDMFARETSNVRRAYSRGPVDPVAVDTLHRERSFLRKGSRTSLDPVTVEIYTRERSNLRKPTPLERSKSKQGRRASEKEKTGQRASRSETRQSQATDTLSRQVSRLDLDRTPRPGTEHTPRYITDRTPRPGTENTPRRNLDLTSRPGTVNTPFQDSHLKTPRPGTENTPRQRSDRPGTEYTSRQDTHKTPRPGTEQAPRLERGRSFRQEAEATSRMEADASPRPGTENTPRKNAHKTPRPATQQTPRLKRENSFRGEGSRMSVRPGTEQTPRRQGVGASRPGTEQTSRADRGRVSQLDTDRASRQGGRVSRKEPDTMSRPNTERGSRQGKTPRQRGVVSRQGEPSEQDEETTWQLPENTFGASDEIPPREDGDGISLSESHFPSRLASRRSLRTRGMSRILTVDDVSEQVDEEVTSPQEHIMNVEVTGDMITVNESGNQAQLQAGAHPVENEERRSIFEDSVAERQGNEAVPEDLATDSNTLMSQTDDHYQELNISNQDKPQTADNLTHPVIMAGGQSEAFRESTNHENDMISDGQGGYMPPDNGVGMETTDNNPSVPQTSTQAERDLGQPPRDVMHSRQVGDGDAGGSNVQQVYANEEKLQKHEEPSDNALPRNHSSRVDPESGFATAKLEGVKNDNPDGTDGRGDNSAYGHLQVGQQEERREESARIIGLGCGGENDELLGRPPTVTSLVSAC